MKKTGFILSLICCLFLASCSSNDDPSGDGDGQPANLGITASTNADAGSSYSYSNSADIRINYRTMPGYQEPWIYGTLQLGIAYLDVNHDGLTDVFMATGEPLLEGEVDCMLELNDGNGGFYTSRSEFNDNMPPATHARKTITADFNNDGLTDLFVFDHGYDADPFPGSVCKLIIQDKAGSFSWTRMNEQGFFHGGAAADIDNDGDIDVFVGGFDPFFYINDGNANFTAVVDRFDQSLDQVFTAELIDVDQDGFVDLLVSGHEFEGAPPTIYWGSTTGSYTVANRTILPPVANYGVVLDFDAADLDNDGDRDLVLNRAGGGNNNFYDGYTVQLLRNDGDRIFVDASSQIDTPGTTSGEWIPWLRVQDIDDDGDLDIIADDMYYDFQLLNDGAGNFTKQVWVVPGPDEF